MTPSLYGLTHSNRNFADPYYWGKNKFNSSFPAALACYMRDRGIPAIYIHLDENGRTELSEQDFSYIFGTSLPNCELYFAFESIYEPFRSFVEDQLVSIDLVLKDVDGTFIRPFEIKLTTLPDETTHGLAEDLYGSEIVLRSATLKYIALSIAQSCNNDDDKRRIRELFSFCGTIQDWSNEVEAKSVLPQIIADLETFFAEFSYRQKPLLLQPIWKTMGKSPKLAGLCLDIFVWSDFALSRLFMADVDEDEDDGYISQSQWTCLRLGRFMWDWSLRSRVFLGPIFDEMETDAEDGIDSHRGIGLNVASTRLTSLAVRREEIKKIILGGGERFLDPAVSNWNFHQVIRASPEIFAH